MKKTKPNCCISGKFPTFAILLIVIGVLWLLNDLNILAIKIPWFPIVLIIIGFGWVYDSFSKK
jgi:hypothetical protein